MSLNVIRCTSTQFTDLTPEVGQVVLIQDDHCPAELKMWTGTEWTEVKANNNSEISLTAYEMNQQLIHQMPALTEESLTLKCEEIFKFCEYTHNVFYMLLCRDTNYYTVCYRGGNENTDEIGTVVIECAQTQGVIKSIEMVEGAMEIWVDNTENDDGVHVMYFFPYDGGVELCR